MNSINSALHLNQASTLTTSPFTLCSPTSALDSQKKRLFMRKPGVSPNYVLAQRRKKESEESMTNQEAVLQSLKSWRAKLKDQQVSKSPKKHKGNSPNNGDVANDEQQSSLLYIPNSSSKQLLVGMRYIHRPPLNHTIHTDYASTRPRLERKEQKQLDETVDISGDSQLGGNRVGIKTQHKSFKYERPFRILDDQKSIDRMVKDNKQSFKFETIEKICPRCHLHQQKVQMLVSTVSQLQRQIQDQTRLISQLSEKNNRLRIQKQGIERELSCQIEGLQERTLRGEYDLSCTFEAAKQEIARLKDRLRYLEMENGVLLRYKEEFSQVTKDIEKYKHQNAVVRRQLNNIAQMDRIQKSKGIGKIKGDLNKGKVSLRKTKEEDLISLNLSEWSVQQL